MKTLPRLHRRGPIEACHGLSTASWQSRLFHGFIAVAPLKRNLAARYGIDDALFHGFIAVAPLKQGTAGRQRSSTRLFHGFIAVAPLKPNQVSRDR